MAELGGVPLMDFSALGQIGDNLRQTQIQNMRRQTLADLAQGGPVDYERATAKLMAAGDMEAGLTLAKLAEANASRKATEAYHTGHLDVERGKLALMRDKAAGIGEPNFGKSGTILQDANGRFFTVQFGNDGSKKIEPIEFPGNVGQRAEQIQPPSGGAPPIGRFAPSTAPQGAAPQPADQSQGRIPLAPAKGVTRLDLGTEWGVQDNATGRIIGRVPKDIIGKESDEEYGKARGQARVALDAKTPGIANSIRLVDEVLSHPGLNNAVGVVAGRLPSFSAASRDFDERVAQLRGTAFLSARQELRGGGAITDFEGARAENALFRASQAKSVDDFRTAMREFRDALNRGYQILRQQAGVPNNGSITPYTQTKIDPRSGAPLAPNSDLMSKYGLE